MPCIGPGSRIGAGDTIVFTGMIGMAPPENEPQCWTVRDPWRFRRWCPGRRWRHDRGSTSWRSSRCWSR